MAIYELTKDCFNPLCKTTYGENSVTERGDLQRLLRDNIDIVSPDTLIISEEFSDWDDSRRRIDLLGVDKNGQLVVIELKRSEDGGPMELQAIRYAAMVANMKFDKAIEVYGTYLERRQKGTKEDARQMLLGFLDWDKPNTKEIEEFGEDVKIVLVSAEFSKELTTSVMWLNERDLDIRCIKMVPYKDEERILVDVQQFLPLPEASDYTVKIKEREQDERQHRAERYGLRNLFWTKLLNQARLKSDLHSRISPGDYSYISAGSGIRGLTFNYTVGQYKSTVELYLDRGSDSGSETKSMFEAIQAHKDAIEKSFGSLLDWQRLDARRACRIVFNLSGGYRTDESAWPEIQEQMIDAMIRFEKALRPSLEKLKARF